MKCPVGSQKPNCPSDKELESFLCGTLESQRAAEIEGHLEECTRCEVGCSEVGRIFCGLPQEVQQTLLQVREDEKAVAEAQTNDDY